MIILRGPHLINQIADSDLRILVNQRMTEICAGEPYDYDRHGYMIVVEPDDLVESLEAETGCPIMHNYFDDARYGDVNFIPSFEVLEEHDCCYEMLFILNDDGFAITLFIPKHGIDAALLKLCGEYSVPSIVK